MLCPLDWSWCSKQSQVWGIRGTGCVYLCVQLFTQLNISILISVSIHAPFHARSKTGRCRRAVLAWMLACSQRSLGNPASLLQLPLEPMFILFCDPRADCPDPNRDLPRSNNTASALAMTLCRACVPERRVWSWAGGVHICNTQEPRRERRWFPPESS